MKRQQVRRKSLWWLQLILASLLIASSMVVTSSPVQAATGNILPPFNTGESWNICQGYGGSVTHTGVYQYALDLTGAGCDNSAAGRTVRAPVSGTVYYYQASTGSLCLNMADGRSMVLTHIDSSITSGSVNAGQAVGTVAVAGQRANGNVAHIHLQMWPSHGCYSNANGGIPFDSAHGAQICGAPDLTASGPAGTGNGTWSGTSFTGQDCGSSNTQSSYSPNLVKNGSFGGGTSAWSVSPNSNFAIYNSGAQSGTSYAATNGGGFYQDITVDIAVNEAFCATASVRTSGGQTGSTGIMKVWLLGGSYNDGEQVNFGPLGSTWKQVKVCSVATTHHTTLRIQFYPTAGPTLNIDSVDVHKSLAKNASFGGATSGWTVSQGANFVTYLSGQQGSGSQYASQSGIRYAATNGGGFYQDIPNLDIQTNDAFCATAEVRTSNGGTGATGKLKIWLLGGSYNDGEDVSFGPLGNTWKQIKVCGVATTQHTTLRIQFYTTSGHTLDVDDVDVHKSLADNASFGGGTAGWSVSPNSNFVTYLSGQQGSGSDYLSQSGIRYAATNGGGFYQDVSLSIGASRTFCVTAEVRTSNGGTGAAGVMKIWQLGGSYNDGESVSFGPFGSDWKQIKACGVATTSHTTVRIQFYMSSSVTMDVDDVDIH